MAATMMLKQRGPLGGQFDEDQLDQSSVSGYCSCSSTSTKSVTKSTKNPPETRLEPSEVSRWPVIGDDSWMAQLGKIWSGNARCHGLKVVNAKMLGKMAKVWYIKKKIKKLSKKLKKHTIAVPVFTAIPIYEHSYYPSPHVTHVSHAGLHHAASSYAPVTQVAGSPVTGSTNSLAVSQGLATSASNTHHQLAAYHHHRSAPHPHHAPPPMYGGLPAAQQIINSYAPSPPLYVDDNGGLYGHYGNAYGRVDGGYHMW